MGKGAKYEMPAWTEKAGGKKKWRKWLDGQASRCFKRARKWSGASTREQWRRAIHRALRENRGGTGHYSGFPLSLDLTPPWTHALWPSVDHVKDPGTVKVVLETRLVNDMKTILDEGEFRKRRCTPRQAAPADAGTAGEQLAAEARLREAAEEGRTRTSRQGEAARPGGRLRALRRRGRPRRRRRPRPLEGRARSRHGAFMRGDALLAAVAWCRLMNARTVWSTDEQVCTVRVPLPGRAFTTFGGSGPDLVTAVEVARAWYRAYLEDPPTRVMRRPKRQA